MAIYGISDIRLIKGIYEDSVAKIEQEGELTTELKIDTGVEQGCMYTFAHAIPSSYRLDYKTNK